MTIKTIKNDYLEPKFLNGIDIKPYLEKTLDKFDAENIENWYRGIKELSTSDEHRYNLRTKIELLEKAQLLTKLKEWYCHTYKTMDYWRCVLTDTELELAKGGSSKLVYSLKEKDKCDKAIISSILTDIKTGLIKIYPVGKIINDGSVVFFEQSSGIVYSEYTPTITTTTSVPSSILPYLHTEFPMALPNESN